MAPHRAALRPITTPLTAMPGGVQRLSNGIEPDEWQRVAISYSLFGDVSDWRNHGIETYAAGVQMVAHAWRMLAPGADLLLFLHRPSIPPALLSQIDALAETGAIRVLPRPSTRGRDGARWRFDAIWMEYRFVFPRDLDSLPRLDEVANMRFFMRSERALQLLRSRWHVKRALAGLCGINASEFRRRYPDPATFWLARDYSRYGAEERRLNEIVGELGADACVEGHNSSRIAGSLQPTDDDVLALQPRITAYPRAGFIGKVQRRAAIAELTARLRQLAT